jgi:hypothetical protein
MALRYRQARNLKTRIVDGEAFVIARDHLKHLNQVASIIWLSLTKPATEAELVEILQTIYPDQQKASLRKDIRNVLRQLVKDQLATKIRTSVS